jgi:hypothetical protein
MVQAPIFKYGKKERCVLRQVVQKTLRLYWKPLILIRRFPLALHPFHLASNRHPTESAFPYTLHPTPSSLAIAEQADDQTLA